MEVGVGQRQRTALVADAGAVAVRHRSARELEPADRDGLAAPAHAEDGLAVRRRGRGHYMHRAAHGVHRDAVLDGGEVVGVGARLHLDHIAVLRCGNCVVDRAVCLACADRQSRHCDKLPFL